MLPLARAVRGPGISHITVVELTAAMLNQAQKMAQQDNLTNIENESLWDDILSGNREPLDIIYVLKDIDPSYLDSIQQWGDLNGLYVIDTVESVEEALELNNRIAADVIVLCNSWVDEARQIAQASPQTPICMAKLDGFREFDFSIFPSQVINAGWVAPREGEFMDSIATALSKVATEIIYQANLPKIEIVKCVSEELLSRLARYPEERFRLNPRLFEETVAELLDRMGYEVRLTPRTGDKGRDVIAYLYAPVAPILMLVECKRYAPHRLVGPEPITRLWYRMFDDHANMAMVITTSGYQPIAKETAINRGYQISLKDGEDFIEWVETLKR